jgi:formate dehydrogenase major subunit
VAGLAAAFGRGSMTNHWSDIANATCVIAWGANPTENHPACIAHVNRARFPQQFFGTTDPVRAAKRPAQLIVIDPRKTRTALQCHEDDASKPEAERDKYVRIRPGTDIALANGLVNYIISQMEDALSPVPAATKTAFFAYLNQNGAGTFYTDGNGLGDLTSPSASVATSAAQGAGLANGNSKYTDARFLVNAGGTDYQRDKIVASTGAITAAASDNTTISNFPLKATSVTADPNTVYNRLKAHVAPYTLAVVSDICGCSTADIQFIGNAMIANSRCSDPNGLAGVSGADPRANTYRAFAMLYAMGITQHTCGSQNVKSFAVIQTLMGNMGRAGGGINALRGIHNVQGSTDMGLLYGNIPAYSGNPGTQVAAIPDTAANSAFGKYMNALWGNPLSGSSGTTNFTGSVRAKIDGSYDDAYDTRAMALQQRGFYNMTLKWFGGYTNAMAATDLTTRRTIVDAAYSLWPKTNGDNHITMFRKMGAGTITGAVVWGQNPAVTEPNQGAIRTGLFNLDTLVVVDMFATETAQVSRKGTGRTYLIPAAAHVEKAGSATNSGRTLQWRYQAAAPAGNTKDDTELLLRFAKALDTQGAFAHIKAVWDAGYGITYDTSVYKELYGNQYGYQAGVDTYSTVSGTGDLVTVRKNVSDAAGVNNAATLTGSEWVNELVYRQMCLPSGSGGTIWIYTGAYNNITAAITVPAGYVGAGSSVPQWTHDNRGGLQNYWEVMNRAKSRNRTDDGNALQFHGWGYSWLVNRRVLYNNSEVVSDVGDFFMGPDSCSRLFVSTNAAVLNYSRWYRTIHRLSDVPSPVVAAQTASPHYAGTVSYAGRFPAHVEPYESPRPDLAASTKWGHNTSGTAWNLVKDDTPVAGRGYTVAGGKPVNDPPASDYPLVLTTIRCVEHFQGGPITRNNWLNVELEPEPWIELTPTDARRFGIANGDMVKVITARTEGLAGDMMANYGSGFRARVGSGLAANQKVAVGVCAIPWHWGDRGLSTGSRANDITIDAMDANTTIPEYKACLCRLEKM